MAGLGQAFVRLDGIAAGLAVEHLSRGNLPARGSGRGNSARLDDSGCDSTPDRRRRGGTARCGTATDFGDSRTGDTADDPVSFVSDGILRLSATLLLFPDMPFAGAAGCGRSANRAAYGRNGRGRTGDFSPGSGYGVPPVHGTVAGSAGMADGAHTGAAGDVVTGTAGNGGGADDGVGLPLCGQRAICRKRLDTDGPTRVVVSLPSDGGGWSVAGSLAVGTGGPGPVLFGRNPGGY